MNPNLIILKKGFLNVHLLNLLSRFKFSKVKFNNQIELENKYDQSLYLLM